MRVLEEKEIERVGDQQPISVNVRIISATNRNLEDLIEQGRFREDLRLEREKLIKALCQCQGNQSEVARLLGLSRVTIWKRIKKYGIDLTSDIK